MAADVANSLKSWSSTESSNSPSGSTAISTNLDDNLRMIQKVMRDAIASQDTIASASTCDIGAKDAGTITVTGTTTITSFGTVSAGITKWLVFSSTVTITYNATSLILPSSANITTQGGDVACFQSAGSGNWRCLSYLRADGNPVLGTTTFGNGSAAAPSVTFTSDTDTGLYRIGANSLGVAAGGSNRVTVSDAAFTVSSGGTVAINSAASSTLTLTAGALGSLSINSPKQININSDTDATDTLGEDVILNTNISVDTRRHLTSIIDASTALSSGGGTGASLTGNDNFFVVTLGTSPGTTPIVVNFARTFRGNGHAVCVYNAATGSSSVVMSATTPSTNITLTPSASMTAGDRVVCFVMDIHG